MPRYAAGIGWALMAALLAGCAGTAPSTPGVALTDTYWRLLEIDGKPVTAYRGTREPHIILRREDARVTGFAGCNTLAGSYQLSGDDALRLGPLAMTRMACLSPETNAMEAGFVRGLEQAATYRIVGAVLDLHDAAGARRIRLEAGTRR